MPDLEKNRSHVRGVSNHGAAPSFETGALKGYHLSKARRHAPSSGRGGG
jgi:hypothetical protein